MGNGSEVSFVEAAGAVAAVGDTVGRAVAGTGGGVEDAQDGGAADRDAGRLEAAGNGGLGETATGEELDLGDQFWVEDGGFHGDGAGVRVRAGVEERARERRA